MFPDYTFESRYVQISGNRMHYIDEGQGPVILMIHGNPTWSYHFRHLIQLFSKNHRVIAMDHIGCGLSDKPQEYSYTLTHHIENLEYLCSHLGVESYTLMVHDWGGAIGMGMASRQPERVNKIVVFNTAAFRSQDMPFRIRLCKLPVLGALIVRGINGFAWPATFMAVVKPLVREVKAAYLAPYNSWQNRVAVAAFVKDIPLHSDHVSYHRLTEIEQGLQRLQEMQIPMLILWGGQDFCFHKKFYDEWCRRFPEAEHHYFADGGHYIIEDKLAEITPLLRRFLDSDNNK